MKLLIFAFVAVASYDDAKCDSLKKKFQKNWAKNNCDDPAKVCDPILKKFQRKWVRSNCSSVPEITELIGSPSIIGADSRRAVVIGTNITNKKIGFWKNCNSMLITVDPIKIQKVECNPGCSYKDPLCQANGQYVKCKECGGGTGMGQERCRYSRKCWIPVWTQTTRNGAVTCPNIGPALMQCNPQCTVEMPGCGCSGTDCGEENILCQFCGHLDHNKCTFGHTCDEVPSIT